MQTPNQPVASEMLLTTSQRGVTLIEVLIAVLVLSIGLLGVAFLQVRALSGNNSSMARSMAVVASYSILEAMRIDRERALAGDYNQTMLASNCDESDGDCGATGSGLAVEQLNNWCFTELFAKLGSGSSGEIECANTGVCAVTITFHTLDCGVDEDGQEEDGLCTESTSEGRAQQIVTQTLL